MEALIIPSAITPHLVKSLTKHNVDKQSFRSEVNDDLIESEVTLSPVAVKLTTFKAIISNGPAPFLDHYGLLSSLIINRTLPSAQNRPSR